MFNIIYPCTNIVQALKLDTWEKLYHDPPAKYWGLEQSWEPSSCRRFSPSSDSWRPFFGSRKNKHRKQKQKEEEDFLSKVSLKKITQARKMREKIEVLIVETHAALLFINAFTGAFLRKHLTLQRISFGGLGFFPCSP